MQVVMGDEVLELKFNKHYRIVADQLALGRKKESTSTR